jgi:hypothetical protein
MAVHSTLQSRLFTVLLPTTAQALGSIVIALLSLALVQGQALLRLTGIGDVAITATRTQLYDRFDSVLTSPIASTTALVTFWASVGLVAYLISWSGYNLLIEARNEVTLNTEYMNRGHWRGHFETLALKAAGAIALVGFIALLKPGFALWVAVAAPALVVPSVTSVSFAIAAALGLAIQLYSLLALALVTFTPWYREEVFTDQ